MLPVTASYAGDSNWLGSVANGGTVTALSSKVTSTVMLSTSAASPASGQNFTLTAFVAGPAGSATPTGTVAFLSDDQSIDIAATVSSGTATLTVSSYAIANGTNIFTAVYSGNNTYTAASSNAVNVATAQTDFSFTTENAEVAISPSGTGISTLAFTPINGFSGTVTLSASAPTGITASPATASLAVSAPATDALNINVAASVASGIYPLSVSASGGGHMHTAQILVRVMSVAAPIISPEPGTYLAV
jgi:hypothetical protein